MATARTWRIGELSRETGLSIRALRYYEERGLLPAATRTESGRRLYSDADVRALYRVIALRALGVPLAGIRDALAGELDPGTLVDRQLTAVEGQQAQLEKIRLRLLALRSALARGSATTTEFIQAIEVITMLESDLPNRSARGKVRDTYDLGDKLLIVATDRISAFDVVLPTAIPRKGEVLTRLSAWWFERIKQVVPNHFIALITEENASLVPFKLDSRYFGRTMLVRKAQRYDAECIARGYISGSGWKDYQRTGSICGIALPAGLQESERLPEPIFTPSTKAAVGHDQNISYEQLAQEVGDEAAKELKLQTLAIYNYAHTIALERGIIIADTKLEFGLCDGEVILIDEALTPDSSRFWPVEGYRPGGPQPSFDKQPVRDWMAANWKDGDPAPVIPPDVVTATTERYMAIYKTLTGEELPS